MELTTEYLLVLLIVLIVFAGLQISKLYDYLVRLNEPEKEEEPVFEPVEYTPSSKKSASPKRGKSQKKTKTTKKATNKKTINKKTTSKKGKKK